MLSRKLVLSLVAAAAFCVGGAFSAHAGDDGAGNPPPDAGKHHGGGPLGHINSILKHATDLNLTDDQKTKLQALADAVKNGTTKPDDVKAQLETILTKDQLEKLKSLRHHGGKGGDTGTPPPGGDQSK